MRTFEKINGEKITNLLEYVSEWTKNHNITEIFIGCDSQAKGNRILYVTAICLYESGKGAHIIHNKEWIPAFKAKNSPLDMMPSKLWGEVERSVEVADMIKSLGKKITIHVDFNSKKTEESNMLHDAGVGYAVSRGYDAVGKPNAWAATHVADDYCR